jgi:hypothetical protein
MIGRKLGEYGPVTPGGADTGNEAAGAARGINAGSAFPLGSALLGQQFTTPGGAFLCARRWAHMAECRCRGDAQMLSKFRLTKFAALLALCGLSIFLGRCSSTDQGDHKEPVQYCCGGVGW